MLESVSTGNGNVNIFDSTVRAPSADSGFVGLEQQIIMTEKMIRGIETMAFMISIFSNGSVPYTGYHLYHLSL